MYVFDCTIWGFHPLGKPAELTAQYLILKDVFLKNNSQAEGCGLQEIPAMY